MYCFRLLMFPSIVHFILYVGKCCSEVSVYLYLAENMYPKPNSIRNTDKLIKKIETYSLSGLAHFSICATKHL